MLVIFGTYNVLGTTDTKEAKKAKFSLCIYIGLCVSILAGGK